MIRQIEAPPVTVAAPVAIQVPIVERAFKLAATGVFRDPNEIAQRLQNEGYLDVQEHIHDCPLLRRQLRECVRQARSA